ncbi:YIF1-domain-containing protein [Vararia minispora EC-137]|uniref:YIF1-domain-containing protein n=1 Tax=Vararia minispora EC-137 TaxID=1314806 RepID=A0ACB8QD03_9AGAM|nr:YIF1-domain-containing protein [Vararia minispora EC-137]
MSYYPRSPPPLQHPVPTHPAFIPEPPSTPASPHGYKRFASSPPVAHPPQPFGSPPQGYTNPFQHQQQQHAPRQAHAGAGTQSSFSVPPADFSAWGLDGATAQLGMQLGQNAMNAGQEYVSKNLGGLIPASALKHHFNVSNSYVIWKLRLLVWPWRHRPWTRKMHRSENGASEFASPRDDLNSPDLYIPVMAFVTYILAAAFQSGLQDRFHPEILGITGSKAVFVLLMDFLFVKGGCYLLGVQGSGSVLDLFAYGGYKFVGVIVTLVAGLLTNSRTLYSLVFLYTFLANAFFLLRSLRSVVLPDAAGAPASVGTVSHAQRSRRITFLFLVAVVQIAWMGILVRV